MSQGLSLFSSTGKGSSIPTTVTIEEGTRIDVAKSHPELNEAVLNDLLNIIRDRLRGCYHVAFDTLSLPKDKDILIEEVTDVLHVEKIAIFDCIAGNHSTWGFKT